MKRLLILPLFLLCINVFAQQAEYYFRFTEPNKNLINEKITKIISIDKLVSDTVYAYANQKELDGFTKLGYKVEMLTAPSYLPGKVLNMATDISQMSDWNRYPTYEVYRAVMKKFEQDYPDICKLDSIGTTVNGRKLYVVKISDNVTENEAEPQFFYTSTIHGDEVTGYVLMLRLTDYLLSQYATNTQIKGIVDNMAIFINPNANPDGTYNSGNSTVSGATRYNANSVDLNRNFPDPRAGNHPDGNTWQAETQAMMNFAQEHNFILSANFHGGTEVANYPWDTWTSSQNTHPDNDWFVHISREYATLAQTNSPDGYFEAEDYGITNGGDWYVITGGRQDYMNWWNHCREITIEISDTKLLSSDLLPTYWNYNRDAMLAYIQFAGKGIQGIITNEYGYPVDAKIFIDGHDRDSSQIYSSVTNGFYARPIEPGAWNVVYSAPGYVSQEQTVEITDWDSKLTKNITLVQLRYNVTFEITYQGNPMENVDVSFNQTNFKTDSEGKATFSGVPYGSGYSYSISLNGYETINGQTDVTDNTTIPASLNLSGAGVIEATNQLNIYPNPFSTSVNINFEVSRPAQVEVSIYSIQGEKVATLTNGTYHDSCLNFTWDGTSNHQKLPPGIYLVTVKTSQKKYTRLIHFNP